ncbi:MAG TPA: arginine--tRNA ligase [Candidatus Omnitrophota bacterium]|nr:arginine--tRNA ligase [Candidatus Omnitrophota bacterium]HQO58842.1 arginine--tRNA ligase [Candidatus Omnitrophota bacterium]HQP11665.1 arginine--tRNA ligase [Candidatus Omnitrophota bacterium]
MKLSTFRQNLSECIHHGVSCFFPDPDQIPPIILDIPQDKIRGEFSCNIALQSARILKKSPMELAAAFVEAVSRQIQTAGLDDRIERVEAKQPGFINFYLADTAFYDILEQVFAEGEDYGRSCLGQGKKIQIEFVSANPTGPLSVAHARQAAVGDCLGNVLRFSGFEVTKEYYVNDEGNQINILGRSILARAREILGDTQSIFPEDGYQGDYIRDMARVFIEQGKVVSLSDLESRPPGDFSRFGVETLMAVIQKELKDFGVQFNTWSYQSRVASRAHVEKTLSFLEEKGFLYEKEGALWFSSTRFGDDKDRVLRKSDGAYTYFAPDIAYHQNKFLRGFDKVVNIWGPDHHGYIPRLSAAVEALGQAPDALKVLIVQLATLYRDGQPVSMSTRRGQYISLREVMDEVGMDAARFFFLMRSIKAQLDFDLELAKKETPENPVYYIQYAHARIHSIVAKAREVNLEARTEGFKALVQEEEQDLMKTIGRFTDVLHMCCHQWDVFALVSYLLELATAFHRFYDKHRVVDVEAPDLSSERLALIVATRIVLANGLRLVGVSAPVRM